MKRNWVTTIVISLLVTSISAQSGKPGEKITLKLDSFTAKINRQVNPQIIDARSAEEFALNHINNALNFNVQTAGYIGLAEKLDKSRPVFIYAINTGRSTVLGNDLKGWGFGEVYDLEGGIANWIGSGQPYYTALKKGLSLAAYQAIVAAHETVLVDIGSRYCPACKKAKPVLDSLRNEYQDKITILEIDLEESPQLIAQLKTVDVFPYLILYKHGAVALKKSGLNALKDDLESALANAK